MTDRKLTEAEMISYLELSVELGNTARLAPEEAKTLLDLINRQKEKIDDLKVKLDAMRGAANSYKMHYENAKSEAVKEFAERVKAHTRHLFSGVDVGHIVDELVIQETEERTE